MQIYGILLNIRGILLNIRGILLKNRENQRISFLNTPCFYALKHKKVIFF